MPAPASTGLTDRPRLLVLDDEVAVRAVVERLAWQLGFEVEICPGVTDILHVLARRPAVLALVDVRKPGVNGLDLLHRIRADAPGCEVVLMGGQATADCVINALKHGAREYIAKPLDLERLKQVIDHLRDEAGARAHIFALQTRMAEHAEFCGMVGRSPVMQNVFNLIHRLAPHASHVLISGETGTGKELVAHAFHQTGPRLRQPFVTVNCSSVDAARLESALAAAEGGTVFLDAVGDLPPAMQARLQRATETCAPPSQNGVGVAMVAVTSRDLRADSVSGRFNRGLLGRLHTVEVRVPPLRERREDIPYLTAAFVQECARLLKRPFDGLTPAAERMLFTARWDGNVRELRHVIERACLLTDSTLISERDLIGPGMARWGGRLRPAGALVEPTLGREPRSVHPGLLERKQIVDTLHHVGGNRMAAAKALGISRRALYRRLERHHITYPAPRSRGGQRGGNV